MTDVVAQGLTFPFALHIPDWNYIIMNTMSIACEAVECWSRSRAEMRSLTKCSRNEDCRVAIHVYHFRSFKAGSAKWRYVTVGEVVSQLAPSASFVQQGFLAAFHITHPERLDEACKDVELWVFIQAVAPFMQKADRLRQ